MTVDEVLRLSRPGLPAPDIDLDDMDGETLVEWHIVPRQTIAMSIGTKRVSWAALIGNLRSHGSFPATPVPDALPLELLDAMDLLVASQTSTRTKTD